MKKRRGMKDWKTFCFCAVIAFFLGAPDLSAHYRAEQYREIEKRLDEVLVTLSKHLNGLETTAGHLERDLPAIQDPCRKHAALAAVEIMQHQAMRAWYNRLLLQNLSDEAVSLGQMSTVVNLTIKSLGAGVYKMAKIRDEEHVSEQKRRYAEAAETMGLMVTLYKEVSQQLKSAIRMGR
jgi:hypothetical protein